MTGVSVRRLLKVGALLVVTVGPLAGCAGISGIGDVFSGNSEWFTRRPRILGNNLALETPPLTPQRPIGPDDLISADGMCSGMTPQGEANAMSEGEPAAASPTAPTMPAGIGLGRTECEVARYAGQPDNVELGNNTTGDRTAVLTYLKGPRPGIYHFVAGRLTSVDRAPVPEAPAKPARPSKSKKRAAT
jgi:hypothetical protein